MPVFFNMRLRNTFHGLHKHNLGERPNATIPNDADRSATQFLMLVLVDKEEDLILNRKGTHKIFSNMTCVEMSMIPELPHQRQSG